jgi:transposase
MSQLPARYKTYSPEFRDEAARMVVETSRDIADVARELGITETSRELVRAYRKSMRRTSRHCRISDRARLREIERENRELRMKNEFLSKAAAYFAAEHG